MAVRPVEIERHLASLVLQIARDVLEFGKLLQAVHETVAYRASSAAFGSCMLYWYSVRLTMSSTEMSCTGCMYRCDAVQLPRRA